MSEHGSSNLVSGHSGSARVWAANGLLDQATALADFGLCVILPKLHSIDPNQIIVLSC